MEDGATMVSCHIVVIVFYAELKSKSDARYEVEQMSPLQALWTPWKLDVSTTWCNLRIVEILATTPCCIFPECRRV
jgi:hypothetical protein